MQKFLEVGQIVNTFGINGFLKIIPYTDDITRFNRLKTIYIEKDNKLEIHYIEQVKYHNKLVLLKLKDVDMDKAERYKNCYIKIDRKEAVPLKENSFFIVDLIGLEVITINNEFIGNIVEVFSTKSNDVYVVKNDLGKEILIPAIKQVIKQVDLDNKKVIIELIEGLI